MFDSGTLQGANWDDCSEMGTEIRQMSWLRAGLGSEGYTLLSDGADCPQHLTV